VQVWASQLAANDFPPVCAMTGKPAETWRKFRFATPPGWAYAFLALIICGLPGIIVAGAIVAAVSTRASGFLPLTRGSSRLQALVFWIPVGLIIAALALMTGIVIAALANVGAGNPNASAGGLLFLLGIAIAFLGLLARLVVTPLMSLRGRVAVEPGYPDKLVELRNVHPAFVTAVRQIHESRAAHYSPTQPPGPVPLPPGSN
jgi:hypothetical protein